MTAESLGEILTRERSTAYRSLQKPDDQWSCSPRDKNHPEGGITMNIKRLEPIKLKEMVEETSMTGIIK